jgi:CRP/FNR family transcriptional regulator, cyclic AMP receptor protein
MPIRRSRELASSALLADLDPELLEAVPEDQRAFAARHLRVPTLDVTRGAWTPPSARAVQALLIADGVIFRCVRADGHVTGDLLGSGDVVPLQRDPLFLPGGEAQVEWHVLADARVAVLDARLAAWGARWPSVVWSLLRRGAVRTDRLMARFALVHRQRVEERLLVVLWELAERWGRVTPAGVVLPIPLRHHHLASLVASLRPSVSLALQRLAARGIVERCVHGYVLHGTLEEGFAKLGSAAGAAAAG